ncbi:hypothetical protein XENTR_v10022998 [Xenopus tropicalis]|uniref:Uncharacterized protein LOC100496873 isoform X1 n=1 Tax=Xenopus tropicalis TaxID=8364 RepID=A0A8J0R699_XENTR|nr:uncharacterized protein LOC100496873 isoform X1 [Xenopus tropicalis]KAE8577644.1 hypothetical protein XENTR_v10022998 [Xenopus tropicalis]
MCQRVVTVTLLILIFCRLKTPVGSSGPNHLLSQDVFLKCLFVADPMPIKPGALRVRWEHNGRTLVRFHHGELVVYEPRARFSQAEVEKGNVSLTLTNVTLRDSGQYIGAIHYGVSQVQCGFTLTVQEQNQISLVTLSAPEHAALAAAHKATDPTHLPLGGSDHEEAPVGTNVTLRCSFTTEPGVGLSKLTVEWTKDGKSILFANKNRIYPPNAISEKELLKGEVSLPLSNVTREDAGKYTCSIQYGTKRGSLSVTLRVPGDTMGQEGPGPKLRTLEIGLVTGVLVAAWGLALLLFFCYRP